MKSRIGRVCTLAVALTTGAIFCSAQTTQPATTPATEPATKPKVPVNYDESKIISYTLPDALTCSDGTRVADAQTWFTKRRPEVLRLFEENEYGRAPARPKDLAWDVFDTGETLNGKAIRKQVTIYFSAKKEDGPKMHLLVLLPADAKNKPVPLFLCLTFSGLHQIIDDPAVKIWPQWDRNKKVLVTPPADAKHGGSKGWEIEKTLDRGYGLAWINFCDIEPDFEGGMPLGVRALYLKPGQEKPAPDEWGAIAAWAWGSSCALDYFQHEPTVDGTKVIMLGQSRLGKTALWTGAADERFAGVVASCSGMGGAKISRRNYGETVKNMNVNYAYQFCENFQKYGDHTDQLPMDSHELIALVAPRPLFLNTGSLDQWSDPKGEFLSAIAAGPVYKLLGGEDLGTTEMFPLKDPIPCDPKHPESVLPAGTLFPPIDQPIIHTLSFRCHNGKHDILNSDWPAFLDWADKYVLKK